MDNQKFLNFLLNSSKNGKLSFKEDAKLDEISTFGIGGKAKFLVSPHNEKALIETIKNARNSCIRHQIIGNGSNILFSEHGFDGVIIRTKELKTITDNETLCVECGVMLPFLCRYAQAHSYDGFAGLCSIPATIGGAFYSNAGAYGYEISDKILSYRIYLPNEDTICTKSVKAGDFSYRNSPICDTGAVLLSVSFMKTFKPSMDILEEMRVFTEKRIANQPLGQKSAGCYFKKPTNSISASELIDKAGLKGMAVNGARVSNLHAGFIINDGNATSEDVRNLAEMIRQKVYEKFGYTLTDEVVYIE